MIDYYKSFLNKLCIEWMMYVVNKWYSLDSFCREIATRVTCTPMPMYVYKVVHIDETIDKDCTEDYYNGCFMERIVLKSNDTGDFESVDEYQDHRVEYRITWNRKSKYRVVSTLSSPMQPKHEMFVGCGGLSTRPKIICAMLKDGDGTCNVVDRVLKYAGPKHDFFEQKEFRMRWMFENDDLKPDTRLEMLLSNVKTYTFGIDDIIDFKNN
jgi:hypothetical protein